MSDKITTIFLTAKICWASILLGIEYLLSPRMTTIAIVFVLVVIDFLTGITKAKIQGVARTSEGFRKTLIKVLQYTIVPLVFWLGGLYVNSHIVATDDQATMIKISNLLKKAGGWIMLFIIYIEVTSIFENLYEIDKKGAFSKMLKPVLILLKFGIDNNPFKRAADKLIMENKDVKVTMEEDKTDSNITSSVTVEAKKPETPDK